MYMKTIQPSFSRCQFMGLLQVVCFPMMVGLCYVGCSAWFYPTEEQVGAVPLRRTGLFESLSRLTGLFTPSPTPYRRLF